MPTSLSLTTAAAPNIKVDALVVGVHASDEGLVLTSEPTPESPWQGVVEAAALAGVTGSVGECAILPGGDYVAADRLVLVGLGEADKLTGERVRRAAGAAARAVAGLRTVATTLSAIDLTATAEGFLLGGYQFGLYKDPTKEPVKSVKLVVPSAAKAAKDELRQAVITAEAVSMARDLVNTAPNDLPPAAFADRAASAAKAAGLTVQVLDEKALAKHGYGGILAVGQGSARPPRLVRISYKAKGAKTSAALVGKGITFDTGGISIKPGPGMEAMTSDMAGAAAVVATVIAAAALKLPINVTATVPVAENMPSGTATRPGDVLTHYAAKGQRAKTSHVLNTDAEGRLILADALVRACEDSPDYLIDVATLTGAQMVALGTRTMGVMGTDELRDRVAELGREVGEDAWAMPLPEDLREGLKSYLADVQNIAGNRWGGMLVAGHYLAEFVDDDVQWAHLDVAGPAFNEGKTYGYNTQGGTGVPVRTLLATLADLAAR